MNANDASCLRCLLRVHNLAILADVIDLGSSMSPGDFSGLVERENERIELKTGTGRRPLQATMVAMSNTEGGLIIIGVADDRTVVGRRRDQGVDDEVHGAAFDATSVGRLEIREVMVGQKPVVAVTVHPRVDDVAATSDGRVLVRQGGHNRALAPREVAELYTRRARIRFESTDSGVEAGRVDRDLARGLAEACGWPEPDKYEDRWRERGLLNDLGRLTIAGALILTDPATTLGSAKFRVDIRVYEDDAGTSYVNREVLTGPVQHQVQSATDMVTRFVGTEMIITGARRHDVSRLPRRVIREVIANAAAHRTYELDATPVVIEIRPSAVTVTSPGGLPDPVTVDTLRQAQAPRNHTVIDLLRRYGLAEDSGQGIDVIEDDMRLELLAEPVFTAEEDSFTVQLPLRGLVSTTERGWLAEFERTGLLQSGERILLVTLAREESLTNSRARDVLGVDSTEARVRLQRLRDAGILVQHGTRGRAYYTLGSLGPDRSEQQIVLDAVVREPLTNEKVRSLTGLDRTAARSLLRRLVDEGRLVQHGERRGTYYTSS